MNASSSVLARDARGLEQLRFITPARILKQVQNGEASSNFPALGPFHHCADGILRVFDEPGGLLGTAF